MAAFELSHRLITRKNTTAFKQHAKARWLFGGGDYSLSELKCVSSIRLAATWSRSSVLRCRLKSRWLRLWLAADDVSRSSTSIIGSLCQRWIWLLKRLIALFKCGSELCGAPITIASGCHSWINESTLTQSWRPLLTTIKPAGVALLVNRLPLAAPVRFKPISNAKYISALSIRVWRSFFLATFAASGRTGNLIVFQEVNRASND